MMYLLHLLLILLGVKIELSQSYKPNENEALRDLEELSHDKDFSIRHRRKDSNYLQTSEPPNCTRNASCIDMTGTNFSCMGTVLPYSGTSFALVPEYSSIDEIKTTLNKLEGLRHIPKCWTIVQPLVCSVFMPRCSHDVLYMPSHETCKLAMGPCRAVLNHTIWPSMIKCEDTKLFPTGCRRDTIDIKFNNNATCLPPLIQTDNPLAVFDGIDGCGYPCQDPLYSTDEHTTIHTWIACLAGISFVVNTLTAITFMLDWKGQNKYPGVVIFYINCCFIVSSIGWLMQFLTPGNRESIVCKDDGTLRRSDARGLCMVVFWLVYYSIVAAMVWFVIFTYAWNMTSQSLNNRMQDKIVKQVTYFHIMAWCLPLVMTVTIVAIGEIDGNSLTGICFVGYFNRSERIWFLLVPLLLVLLIGGFFSYKGLSTLIRVKIGSKDIISEQARAKIQKNIFRMARFLGLTFAALVLTFCCHTYDFIYSEEWKQSFRNYVMCSITTKYTDGSECKIKSRPNLTVLIFHLIIHTFAGLVMTTWFWNAPAARIWARSIRRIFKQEVEEKKKRKKHKVIAQAFAKRMEYNNDGRLSINFCSSHHEDPFGLNFDPNSVASQALSSTWAAALPQLVNRRGAIIGSSASISSNKSNSVDSEIISFRRVSVESRRNSVDSQLSVTIEEVQKRKISRREKRRRDYPKGRSRKSGPLFRRGSTTSQESQLGEQIMNAISNWYAPNVPAIQLPNMNRRPAFSVHEVPKIMDEKSAGKLFPFLLPAQSGSEDNISTEEKNESFKCTSEQKNIDLEAGNPRKDDQDSDNDSHIDEQTNMLEPPEEPQERSKSKSSNTSRSREARKSKHNETMKHLLQKSEIKLETETKTKDNSRKGAIGDLAANLPPYCQERVQTDGSTTGREIATQTSVPIDVLEMEELKQSIDEIINSRKKF